MVGTSDTNSDTNQSDPAQSSDTPSASRVKRPPRIPRVLDETATTADASNATASEGAQPDLEPARDNSMQAVPNDTMDEAFEDLSELATVVAPVALLTHTRLQTAPEDMETVESPAVATAGFIETHSGKMSSQTGAEARPVNDADTPPAFSRHEERDAAARITPRTRLVIGFASDVGASRRGEVNEDSVGGLVLDLIHNSVPTALGIGIIADGLGGHSDGQTASLIVTRSVLDYLIQTLVHIQTSSADATPVEASVEVLIRSAIQSANSELMTYRQQHEGNTGSTVVAAVVTSGHITIANVGDSRAYVMGESDFRQITTDQSLVQQLIAAGLVKPEERHTHPQRNRVLHCLGDVFDVPVDVFSVHGTGEPTALCSDGLWECYVTKRSKKCSGRCPIHRRLATNSSTGQMDVAATITFRCW